MMSFSLTRRVRQKLQMAPYFVNDVIRRKTCPLLIMACDCTFVSDDGKGYKYKLYHIPQIVQPCAI